MQTQTTLDLTADVIDVRDIIARFEELETARDDFTAPNRDGYQTSIGADEIWVATNPDDAAELTALRDILAELAGYGGDEQWRGDWYPVTLVCDSHFRAYAEQLADDCGYIEQAAEEATKNPLLAYIDWEAWSRDVRMDYTPVQINGLTYWYR